MPRTVRTAPARKAAERTAAARPATARAKRAAPAKTPAKTGTGTSKDVMTTVQTEPAAEEIAAIVGMDGLDAEVATAATMSAGTLTEAPAPAAEVDLDDQTSTMGDSVHTYLKSIGRTSLLTAEQEVNLAKRIEAGLYAEHKLETEPDLDVNSLAFVGSSSPATVSIPGITMISTTSTAYQGTATTNYQGFNYYNSITAANTNGTSTAYGIPVADSNGSIQSQWYANSVGGTPSVSAISTSTGGVFTTAGSWKAPIGLVTSTVSVTVYGQNGSGGGSGVFLSANFNPTIGSTYYYNVTSGSGVGGNTGWFGVSSTTFSTSTVLLIGAGGGAGTGGGNAAYGSNGGAGGNGSGYPTFGGGGGAGGTLTAGGVGGAAATYQGNKGGDGGPGYGGSVTGECCQSGGGGGAGFFGGGGGGSGANSSGGTGGGGGGGRAFATSTATITNISLLGASSTAAVVISGTEQMQFTIVGTNMDFTVSVPASTTDLNPTEITVNFAATPSFFNAPICVASMLNSTTTPYIISESTSSVVFGFNQPISGSSFNGLCRG